MRKGIKIILKTIGALLVFLLIVVIAVPYLFKDELIETVRKNVDKQIEGAFYFDKADVGLLKTFPNLCLELSNPVLTGTQHPNGDSLFTASSLGLVVDIMSVIRRNDPIRIVGVRLEDPRISLYTGKDGSTNYALVESSDTSADSSQSDSLIIDVDSYTIVGGAIRYEDAASNMVINVTDFDHSGDLRYAGDLVTLHTQSDRGILTLTYDGIAYLDAVNFSGKNDLELDLVKSLYVLQENSITLNALNILLDGAVAQTGDVTNFDLTFSGEKNAFKNFLSLLPNMYTKDFDKLDASGNLSMEGSLKGDLSETSTPIYQVALGVDQGAFQFPGKPLGFTDIVVDATLHNAVRGWDPVEVNIASLRFKLNNQPFSARIHALNPTGNATFEGVMQGVLDLADVANAYPMDAIQELSGRVDADVTFDVAPSRQAAQQKVTGKLLMDNIRMRTQDQQLVLASGSLDFDPALIHMRTDGGAWNGAPFDIDVSLRNTINWLTEAQQLSVAGQLAFTKIDLNSLTESPAQASSPSDSAAVTIAPNIYFDGSVAIDTFVYDTYEITGGSAQIRGTLEELSVSQLKGSINGTTFLADATFKDIDGYLEETAPLTGAIDCTLGKVYADKWLATDPESSSDEQTPTEYAQLPADLNLDITFRGESAYYDKIDIRQPRGSLKLHDQMLEVVDFRGEGLGGTMVFSGLYNTQNTDHPAFNLKYDLSSLSFTETFQEVEMFEALAPVARFIKGIFNSTLVMEGRLGEDYMPDLNTLTASGFLETVSGKLEQAQFFEKLSQFLNLKKPLVVDLGQTKNWFEVKNGYVIMQEMTKNFDDIEMAIGGKHQIKGDMDYLIKLNLPADRLTSNPVGAAAKAGYDQLLKKAAEYGVKLNSIERFIVHVGVKGSLKDPQFSLRLFDPSGKTLGDAAKDQLTQVKEQVTDTLTALGNEKLQQAKDSLKNAIDLAADSARRVAEQRLKEAGKTLTDQAAQKLDSTIRDSIMAGALDKLGGQASEVLGEKAGEQVDKIKDALDKWDPLKKKKKE